MDMKREEQGEPEQFKTLWLVFDIVISFLFGFCFSMAMLTEEISYELLAIFFSAVLVVKGVYRLWRS